MAVPRRRVHLVPPPQPHEPPPGDVLEVVEIRGQEEHGDDEDEHEARGEEPEAEEVDQEGRCWGGAERRCQVRFMAAANSARRAGKRTSGGEGGGLTDAESEEEEQRYGV